MKLLHDISIAGSLVRWCWGYIAARNGHEWANPIVRSYHLYPIHRSPTGPAPIGDHYRHYWAPWGTAWPGPPTQSTDEAFQMMLNPLCGRLPTTSRSPRFYWTPVWYQDSPRHCTRCTTIATTRGLNPAFQNTIMLEDPWHQMNIEQRNTMPDPVSGR